MDPFLFNANLEVQAATEALDEVRRQQIFRRLLALSRVFIGLRRSIVYTLRSNVPANTARRPALKKQVR